MNLKHQYIVNDKGQPTSILIPKKEFDHLMEYVEELEDIAAYKSAVSQKAKAIPWHDIRRA